MKTEPDTKPEEATLTQGESALVHPRPVRPWSQGGFLLVSDASTMPFVHSWHVTEWMANEEKARIEKDLPPHLGINLAVVPAKISFSWPNTQPSRPADNA